MIQPRYFVLFVILAFATIAQGQPAAPAPAPAKTDPGLALTFTSPDGKTDTRIARLANLLVPAGAPTTPFLQSGPFKATFEGYIAQKLRGDFKFSATGNGKVKISIADKPIFTAADNLGAAEEKPATLKKGLNKITIEYESPASGEALLRVAWSSDDFPAEPIPSTLLSHDPAGLGGAVMMGLQLREGRSLFADLHCVRCHAEPSLGEANEKAMPELAKDAPNLAEVGSRLNEKWMARWISDPKSLRPDTSMPNLFRGHGATVKEAADAAAYLATLGKPDGAAVNGDAVAGGKLVARLGCIGCHTLPEKDVNPPDPSDRIPWHYVKAKYTPAGLVEFLKQPEKHYAWIRMPNFRFSDEEAKNLAAYLLANSAELPGDSPTGDRAAGEKLIMSARCIYCHQVKKDSGEKLPALAAIGKEAKGCLAADDAARGKAPDFGLSPAEREALLAFVGTDRSSLKQDVPAEFAERQVTELRCTACHNRDLKMDTWDDLSKEVEPLLKGETLDPEAGGAQPIVNGNVKGAIPGEALPGTGDQSRPPLTWVGEKLHPEWMATFIGGKLDYKPRAWMIARMPGFPARAQGLAVGLAQQHAAPAVSPAEPAPDAELAKIGMQLVSRNGGFSCVQCHGIAAIGPISPFEAPSINFKYLKERIRKEYYDRWMRDPTRLVANTKMPKFQNDGKTALSDVLEGDANKQFDAIWNYLQAGREIKHPEQ